MLRALHVVYAGHQVNTLICQRTEDNGTYGIPVEVVVPTGNAESRVLSFYAARKLRGLRLCGLERWVRGSRR